MSRKDRDGFGDLLRYIDRPEKKSAWTVRHNFFSDRSSLGSMEAELLDNAALGRQRKNGVWLYHEVMSWGPRESINLTESMMQDVAHQYLLYRAAGALGYARAHFDTEHPHVHFLISAHELGTGKKMRLSKAAFAAAKRAVIRYQRERYPELAPEPEKKPKRKRARRSQGEQALARRRGREGGRISHRKAEVGECLRKIFDDRGVQHEADLNASLMGEGLVLYRRGKTVGVEVIELPEGGKRRQRYRFKTLGVIEDYEAMLHRWEQRKQRTKRLWSVQYAKLRKKYRCWEFGKLVERVLEDREEGIYGAMWRRKFGRRRGMRR